MLLSMWWLVSFSTYLFLAKTATAFKGDSGCGYYLCVNATRHADLVTYEMSLIRTPSPTMTLGWLALGFGRRMKGTHMVIMWKNPDNSVTLSQRYATGHTEPQVEQSPPRLAVKSHSRLVRWSTRNIPILSFDIPYNYSHHSAGSNNSAEKLIWAFSVVRPNTSAPDAYLSPHFLAGFVTLDLEKDQSDSLLAPGETSDVWTPPALDAMPDKNYKDEQELSALHDRLVAGHGFLLSIGFLVLLPIGTLLARLTRTLTPRWIFAHRLFNYYLACPIIITGWLLGPLAVMDARALHFMDAHQICGSLLLLIYLAQLYVGRYIHSRRAAPGRGAHPPSNMLHVFLGITLLVLAFLQVRSGFDELEMVTGQYYPPLVGLWQSWAIILLLFYLFGMVLLPRQLHQERNGLHAHHYALVLEQHSSDEMTESTQNLSIAAIDREIDSLSEPLLKHS